MGDSSHSLVREMHYSRDRTDVIYFELVHIQWMPMRRPYLDVIEARLGENNGNLVSFGQGAIEAFQFRERPHITQV